MTAELGERLSSQWGEGKGKDSQRFDKNAEIKSALNSHINQTYCHGWIIWCTRWMWNQNTDFNVKFQIKAYRSIKREQWNIFRWIPRVLMPPPSILHGLDHLQRRHTHSHTPRCSSWTLDGQTSWMLNKVAHLSGSRLLPLMSGRWALVDGRTPWEFMKEAAGAAAHFTCSACRGKLTPHMHTKPESLWKYTLSALEQDKNLHFIFFLFLSRPLETIFLLCVSVLAWYYPPGVLWLHA